MIEKNDKQRTYDEDAIALAQRYNSITAYSVFPYFFDFLDTVARKNIKILDLGAGAGRDAFKMAEMGFDVVAVDGSANMLAQARIQKSHDRIAYVHDKAPTLNVLSNKDELKNSFNIVYMNAFMFHLDATERKALFETLDGLVQQNVSIFMSFKNVGFKEDGRTFYPITAKDIEALGKEYGYTADIFDARSDELGREEIEWTYLRLMR